MSMDRAEFLRKCALLGIALPFLPHLSACRKEDELEVNFKGKVIIVGAGAAGLMAAYMLQRYGIEFQLLEANNRFGGRVMKSSDFADFPIDLGAEWIHTSPTIFARLINNKEVDGEVELIPYNPQTISSWRDGDLRQQNWKSRFYGELKFKRTTWYDFFADYIVPSFQDKILYNEAVTEINYENESVVVNTANAAYTADKVLVTTPIKVLQSNLISFTPPLPANYSTAINEISIPPGFKVFIEFSERFYPDLIMVNDDGREEQLYYDAAFKKEAQRHILGLFYVGDNANIFTDLSDEGIIQKALSELDAMFGGKASKYYLKHIIQNWSKEPYALGSYSHYGGSEHSDSRDVLTNAINNKVHFAGEAIAERDYSTVHGAGLSGFEAIEKILENG